MARRIDDDLRPSVTLRLSESVQSSAVSDIKTLFKELNNMNITLSLAPIVSLIAGILILLVPRLLNYIVAIYLIVIGILGLFNGGNLQF